jgi:hypothetical protein
MIPTLNEGSRCFVKAKFTDKNNVPQIASSLQYRVDCETTNTVLQDWTTVTPAQTVEVQIDATVNHIVRRNNATERKVVTFLANADPATGAFTGVQKYDLVNLQGIS